MIDWIKNIYRKITNTFTKYISMYNKKYKFVNTAIIGTVVASVGVFIDYNNLPSQFLMDRPPDVLFASIILGSILILLFSIKYRVFKNMIYPLINHIDFFIVLGICSLTLFRGVTTLNYEDMFLDIYLIKYLILVLAVFLVIRILSIGKEIKKTRKSIVDLKEILDGTVSYDQPFFIREDAVGYDLLNRKNLIQDLAESIQSYVSDERFVVGIEGAWGTGKTTFLNHLIDNISKHENFVIIDDFEPWLSESKESLLNNLLNTILVKSNLDISKREIDHFVKTISEAVLGKTYVRPIVSVMENIEERRTSNIIEDINYLIDRNDKKIIFIIDNLDRLRPENVYLVLNIVNNVLNFNNLIVILAYDKKELGRGLDSIDISPHYLDKIVQKKIVLPVVKPYDIRLIYVETITKLLENNNIFYNLTDIQSFAKVLSDHRVGIREFKRFINSSVLPFVFNHRRISMIDYLVIEYIHVFNRELYENIYFNQKFFLMYDKSLKMNLEYFRADEWDSKINTLFESIGINENIYGALLKLSFPYVENYFGSKTDYKTFNKIHRTSPSYIGIQKDKRVSSSKFFDLYFTEYTNIDAEIVDYVEAFIKRLKINYKCPDKIREDVKEILKLSEKEQVNFLTTFSLYIIDLSMEEKLILSEILLENYFYFGNYKAFAVLDTKNRLASVISDLIKETEQTDFQNLLMDYAANPKCLGMIEKINKWLTYSTQEKNEEKINFLERIQAQTSESILEKELNLFDQRLYIKGNSFTIYRYLKKEQSVDRFKEYLHKCINKNTYFSILNDLITTITDEFGYSYSIIDIVEDLIDIHNLKEYHSEINPSNERQRILNYIFENHLTASNRNEYGEVAIRLREPVDLTITEDLFN